MEGFHLLLSYKNQWSLNQELLKISLTFQLCCSSQSSSETLMRQFLKLTWSLFSVITSLHYFKCHQAAKSHNWRWWIFSLAIVIFLSLLFFLVCLCIVFFAHLRRLSSSSSLSGRVIGGMTSWSHVLRGASIWKQHARYAPTNVVRERWGNGLFHLRQITISPGLDSNGLSLWNGIPPHALQIYLLFYLPGQAHGKIIPNTCRALSGTLE